MRIRPARADDREFILGLVPRLVEFGDVPGRDTSQMLERDRAVLAAAVEQPPADTEVFVAEADDGTSAGFIHLTTSSDYYTGGMMAHVADIVVTSAAEGHGVGRALLEHAEAWARQRGFTMLTLNVFIANQRAREVYARAGYREEWIRCIKWL